MRDISLGIGKVHTTIDVELQILGEDVDLIINGGAGGFEYSTVVYCVDGEQEIIRQGKGILDD